jgi:hypothetical protein
VRYPGDIDAPNAVAFKQFQAAAVNQPSHMNPMKQVQIVDGGMCLF